ncbi:hypothetical protein GW17_00039815, partial [Ensete ventricosum]
STSTSGATFSGSVESSSLEKHESYHSTCVVQELSQLLESYCYRRKPKSRRGRVCRRYRARSGEEKSNDVSYDLPEPRAQPAKMSSAEEGISTNRVEPKMRKEKPPLHLAVVTTHRKRGCQRRVRGDLAGSECDRPDDWSIKGSVAGSISERVAEATTARGRSSRRLVGSEVVAHVGKESYLVWKQRAEMRQGKTLTEEAMVQPTRCSRAMVES